MNKFSLLIASFLLLATNANASQNNNLSSANKPEMDSYGVNPICFNEGGINFFVYPNGQFDFDPAPVQGVIYNYGRRHVNISIGIAQNMGVNIVRDYYGRIVYIGNVSLDYDPNNRVRRIGSVMMNYNDYGLVQVGGLQIIYDGYNQIIQTIGLVNSAYIASSYPNYNSNYGYYNSNHYSNNYGNQYGQHYDSDNRNYHYNNGRRDDDNHNNYYSNYGNGSRDLSVRDQAGFAHSQGTRDGGGSVSVPATRDQGGFGNAQGTRDNGNAGSNQGNRDQGSFGNMQGNRGQGNSGNAQGNREMGGGRENQGGRR